MGIQCEFCNKEFSNKSSLYTHQKSAKYCLEIQGKNNTDFVCDFCLKAFTLKQTLTEHFYVCKEKLKKDTTKNLNNEINTLKNIIEEKNNNISKLENIILKNEEKFDHYEEKLEKQKQEYEAKILQQKKEYEVKLEKFENAVISVAEASKTPSITYNTNSNNHQVNNNNQILNLSPEVVEPILREKLTFDIAKQGQKGLASFVLNNMLKGPNGELKYKCKDTSRQNFEYINKNGDVEKDVRAKKLSQALVDGGVERIAGEVGSKEWRDDGEKYERYGEKVTEIVMLSADDSTFRNTLTALTS